MNIFSPQMWLLNGKYCKDLDTFILDNLDSLKLKDRYTGELYGVEILVKNFQYTCGTSRLISTSSTGVVIVPNCQMCTPFIEAYGKVPMENCKSIGEFRGSNILTKRPTNHDSMASCMLLFCTDSSNRVSIWYF